MSILSANFCVLVLSVAIATAAVFMVNNVDNRRVDNFSAGPGCMPVEVLKEAQKQFISHDHLGMNIMEMSHRDQGGPVQSMIAEAEQNVRELLDVPENYHVIYMQGGAHLQFAAIPMNLLSRPGSDGTADYVVTGYWSERAMNEAAKQAPDNALRKVAGATEDGTAFKPPSTWGVNPNASYVHICASETIDGLEFVEEPEVPEGVPLVADFTSTLLSRRVDISKYGVIYASGGKNLGPSGFALVIVRDDLIGESLGSPSTPAVMSWYLHSLRKPIPSIYHTPPVYNLYLHSLVLRHQLKNGGMAAYEQRAITRASKVYAAVDTSNGFYVTKVSNKDHRSRMNVAMTIRTGGKRRQDLEKAFVEEASAQGMLQLFGHPVRGGLRVTLYNGVPDEAVDRVVAFMNKFAATHGTKSEAAQ